MKPAKFEQSTHRFGPPPGLDETQVMTVDAYVGEVRGGSLCGAQVCVTAWKPDTEELAALVRGEPLFLSFIGSIPPHYPSVDFHSASNPA